MLTTGSSVSVSASASGSSVAITSSLIESNTSINTTTIANDKSSPTSSFQPDLQHIREQLEGMSNYSTLLTSIKTNSVDLPDDLLVSLHAIEDAIAEHQNTSNTLDKRLRDLKQLISPEDVVASFSLLEEGMHKVQCSLEQFAPPPPPSEQRTTGNRLKDLKKRQQRLKELKVINNNLLDLKSKGHEADFIRNISLSRKEDSSEMLSKLLTITDTLPLKEIHNILQSVKTTFQQDLVNIISKSLLLLPGSNVVSVSDSGTGDGGDGSPSNNSNNSNNSSNNSNSNNSNNNNNNSNNNNTSNNSNSNNNSNNNNNKINNSNNNEQQSNSEVDQSTLKDIKEASISLLNLGEEATKSMVSCFIENHIFFQEGPPQREYIISTHHPSASLKEERIPIVTPDRPLTLEPVLQRLFAQLEETLRADQQCLLLIFAKSFTCQERIFESLTQKIVNEAIFCYVDEIFLQAQRYSGSLAGWRCLGRSCTGVKEFLESLQQFLPPRLTRKMWDNFSALIAKKHLSMHSKDEGENMKVLLSSIIRIIVKGGDGEMDAMKSLKRLNICWSDSDDNVDNNVDDNVVFDSNNNNNNNNNKTNIINEKVVPLTSVLKRSPYFDCRVFSYYLLVFGESMDRLRLFGKCTTNTYSFCRTLEVWYMDFLGTLRGAWFNRKFSLIEDLLQQLQQQQQDCKRSLKGFTLIFEFIANTNKILSLLNSFTHSVVGPLLLGDSDGYCDGDGISLEASTTTTTTTTTINDCYRNIILAKNDLFLAIEGKVNRFLEEIINISLNILEKTLLSQQKRIDFRPKELPASLGSGGTSTARATTAFLRDFMSGTAVAVVAPEIRDDFLRSFIVMIVDHIRNFSISDIGAIVLQDDFKSYAATITSFTASLKPEVELLLEIPLLYIVKPDGIVKVVDESKHLLLQPLPLLESLFLSKREDYLRDVKPLFA